ncbi:MAG: hypothetical protein ACFB0C_23390 [Leptolyngbyaceae cyanobacterium]
MATPLMLSESEVTPFSFYSDASIYEGIICSSGAYKLSASFELDQQNEAFQFARKLAKASKVVLTTGEISHRIWVKLGGIVH